MKKVFINGQEIDLAKTVQELEKQKGITKVLYSFDLQNDRLIYYIFFEDLTDLAKAVRMLQITPVEFQAMPLRKLGISTVVYNAKLTQ